jgi:type IV pilus assembly protein PilQ
MLLAQQQAGADGGIVAGSTEHRVTIDVKDMDIRQVLDAFSRQTGFSIVIGKEVTGTVTVRLLDVPWDKALDSILKPYGYGAERAGDVITVLPFAQLKDLSESQPLGSRVFKLKYRDAVDLQPVIESQLSSRGRVKAVEETGQKGWDFGAFGASGSGASANRAGGSGSSSQPRRAYKGVEDRRSRTKTIVVTDIPPVLERISEMIDSLDVMPRQIMIEARFMEVNRDKLRDLGVDIATGANGASTAAIEGVPVDKGAGVTTQTAGGQSLGSLASPSAFGALSSGIADVLPFNTGLSLAFQKLSGTQFQVIVHALEEDVNTNTLSAPSVMTLDNQEANILVGTQFPILTSNVAGTTTTTTTTSLDYYQDIGIQLRVVPQIAGDDKVNMIVHPAVTSFNSTLAARSPEGTTLAEYPILTTREAETQVLMKSGDTIVIGGMLQDIKSKGIFKTPILGDIPLLGLLFRRQTDDTAKIDLLIFITAKIADEDEVATQKPAFNPPYPTPKSRIQWKKEDPKPKPWFSFLMREDRTR